MQQRHKQRLIGAAVLVAALVVFLPMLLQGPVERERSHMSMEIPPEPEVAPTPEADGGGDAPPLEAVPLPGDGGTGADASAETRDAPAPQPPPAEADAPEGDPPPPDDPEAVAAEDSGDELAAWAVQVGSFSQRANALGLRDRLRDQSFSAYVERVEREGDSPLFRLRVGPVAAREEAERLLGRLEGEAELDGLVVRHRP